ncbi:hypothetical protein [Telluribacter sp.]|jgi:hypothetical protein|uniref:hypothetical protein n=1 Tax=Telluribacter sp. TaxID=1978767 RepID=UPI002E1066DA|nr:hypothetical protein [Telluribacter sp.]
MKLTEKELNFLEEQIPAMTEQATQIAYYTTLANGHSVVIAEGGHLVEVFPDGTKKIRKKLPAKPVRATRKKYII